MSNWQIRSIGEICKKVTSGGTPLTSRAEFYLNGTIPWLKTKEINQRRIYSTENFITELGVENSSAKLVPVNTVTVAMYGDGQTAGRVGLTKIPLATNQACCNLIIDEELADPEFIFYLLRGAYDELVARKTGSGQQNLNAKLIKSFEFAAPSSTVEQRAIASTLTCLDDKIELLHRQNGTLEDMAEMLFRQWFLESENEYWVERPLSKIANFLNGLACQKYPPTNDLDKLPVLKIRELSSGISENSDWATSQVKPEYIVEAGDVIFAWSASLMVKLWDGERCVLNQHLFKVTSDEFPKWFYLRWCKHHLAEFIAISASHATTMGHIKRGDLDAAMVLVPPPPVLEAMSQQMKPLLDKQIENARQRKTLEKLRDTLLPKLMSGEVRVAV
ncbi:restriction endonuclease subunit S [Methyloversatilis sp. MC4-4]|uniref:restriction endonuclease subunit S n=1 Tax=Methyloversatilis sp. MC4-4 TaxID=3132824 RepID=UPI003CEBA249